MADKTSSPPSDERPSDERPAHCRSPLWDHTERIEQMLARRYSYQQIAGALVKQGVQLTGSEIGKWCRRQGLRSIVSSRHRADKKSAAQVPAPAAAAAGQSMAELLSSKSALPAEPAAPAPRSATAGSISADLDRLIK